MNGIDLFAGAGGMSLGAVRAGINVVFAVEADRWAADTYECNHAGVRIFRDDIRKLSGTQINRIPRGTDGTIVFGGPPCQGFSYSNQRTRKLENPQNWLFEEFLRVVAAWVPDLVVFENVRGILNTEGGLFLRQVQDGLDLLGYSVSQVVLNAMDYGVPQDRSRLFLLAARGASAPDSWPPPKVLEPLTVADAISDLPVLANGASQDFCAYKTAAVSSYARTLRGRRTGCRNNLVTRNASHIIARYKHIPPGGNWANIPPRLMRNYADRTRCHTGIYYRLKFDEPSVVLGNYRKNMLIHPTEHRGLSVREAARIQSFPDSYVFHGTVGFQQQQVGNAVPPLLAGAVFKSIVGRGKAHGQR